ncbi:MAG: hypothetical protein RLZZ519_2315 [Bacteroidota bacterium]|jgi:hypothetical protein
MNPEEDFDPEEPSEFEFEDGDPEEEKEMAKWMQNSDQPRPQRDLYGQALDKNLTFFHFPKDIGDLLRGYSDLTKGSKPTNEKQRSKRIMIAIVLGGFLGMIICGIAEITDPAGMAVAILLPVIIGLVYAVRKTTFAHRNLFVGSKGFAEFTCIDQPTNLDIQEEIHFEDVTDLCVTYTDHSLNGMYSKTVFKYIWVNRTTGKQLYKKQGQYDKRQIFKDPIGLDFSEASAKYWSIHLMNGFEKKIKAGGNESFYLWSEGGHTFTEFIRLTLGSITFIKDGKPAFTYKLEDIQKIYRKENMLHIQHRNFEKTLFFMRKGNEDVIPLAELSNQGYFFLAMERILGYALV